MKSFAVFRSADIRQVLTSPDFTVEYRFRTSRLAFGETLLDIDGPKHARIRRLVAQLILSPEAQRRFRHASEENAASIVGELPRLRPFEFMAEVAERIPVLNTCAFLGFPASDATWLRGKLALLTAGLTGAELPAGALSTARREVETYILDMTQNSAAGCIAELMLRAKLEGELSLDEMIRAIFVLLAAGIETSECAHGNVAYCLLRFQSATESVRAGGTACDDVIREALRWEPPQHDTVRFARVDTQIAGIKVPAGSAVRLYLASANRDEATYDNPDRFDATRSEKLTLAFGYGAHVCLGSKLSGIQLSATFGELLRGRRFDFAEGTPQPQIVGDTFRRPPELLVTLQDSTAKPSE
jgi:cytochrome P450